MVAGSVENPIIKTLSSGDWVFDLIAPAYAAALDRDLERSGSKCQNASLFELTCRKYRPNLRFPVELISDSTRKVVTLFSRESSPFWTEVLAIASIGSKLAIPSQRELSRLRLALEKIKETCPNVFSTFEKYVFTVCPYIDERSRSFSHPHFFGCLFLVLDREPDELAVSIVHEMAHQEMFLLNLTNRLVVEGADFNLAHAPFQG
jgi:HEXXH motif-containing protein